MSKINIFMPVYHRDETVKKSVFSVLDTMHGWDFEVKLIIVDNRSGNELRRWLCDISEGRDDVEVILLSRNYGKAQAINMAARAFSDFDYFMNCDSDIIPQSEGWPAVMAQCFHNIKRAGMISTDYVSNGNSPMPKQPSEDSLNTKSGRWKFKYGGQVAGGCFLTSASIWKDLGYRNGGVYGGVDGVFRQNVADSLKKKCGYIEGLTVEHLDDRDDNKDYHEWKLSIQNNIKKMSPAADPKKLGNDRGFWDK